MKKNSQLLYDSMRKVDYAEYVEHCELNGLEPLGVESDDYYDFVGRTNCLEWDDLLTNIHYSDVNELSWIITGTIGTWRGERTIYPTVELSLEDAICSCIGNCVCDFSVKKEGNSIFVDVIHHDGRNHFILNALTEKGVEIFENRGEVSLQRKENVVKLPEFLF